MYLRQILNMALLTSLNRIPKNFYKHQFVTPDLPSAKAKQ